MEVLWQSWSFLHHSLIDLGTLHPVFAQLAEPRKDPVEVFLIILVIMLIAPLMFERLKMPGIIGLILAGVLIGPYGLGILERDSTIELLGTVGLLFLMFLGGLETSLDDLKRNAGQAGLFGLATFALPMILGTVTMMLLGYSLLASVLVASCFASHTLVALPVLNRLGIIRSRVVTATFGATLITNVLALLVLAIVVKADQGELTLRFWLFLIPSLVIYTFAILWGIPKLGRWFFHKFGHDESAEFTFVLATFFTVSYLAKLIEIEPIVGAFLAGIAITQLIPPLSPLMNRIQFIGNTLFVPFFLISVGMLVDPLILVKQPQSILVAGAMIGAEMLSKFLAAWSVGKRFRWPFAGTMVAFGLSSAQAASTLAAITVAFNIQLVDELTVNGIIAMILVSCIASPWITTRWGAQMKSVPQETAAPEAENLGDRILVPVANPSTEDNLLQLAIILAKRAEGTLLPLHVLSDRNSRITLEAKNQQKQLLATAETLAHAAVTSVKPIGRVDNSIAMGIVRAAQEQDASLLICGWKGYSTYRENFFGGVIDTVTRLMPVPVLISRFPQPLENTERVLLAVTTPQLNSPQFQQMLMLAKTIAEELKATLTVLHSTSGRQSRRSYEEMGLGSSITIEKVSAGLVEGVPRHLQPNDLLLLIASPQYTRHSALGREPEAIARSHDRLSMLILHFPD